ncbi:ATP-binding protein [Candidatus Lokiarchaeum ossiferum]
MEWIRIELVQCNILIQNFPADYSKYQFKIPLQVDNCRIFPKNDSYIYHDLVFEINKKKIIDLFLTDQLYKDPSLCIRELIQNSLDALEMRRLFFLSESGAIWEQGKIELKHYFDDDGNEILECEDNGIGMDENEILNYLVKIGQGYYQSYEFSKINHIFKKKGFEFNPIAQFGIGFLACFMIGNRIQITTRKSYGSNNAQIPLQVEIDGIINRIVIRKLSEDIEIGTKVKIFCKQKQLYYHPSLEIIKLCTTILRYVRGTNFWIYSECFIPEIAKKVSLPPGIKYHKTHLQKANIEQIKIIEQDFCEINSNLEGKVYETFLINGENNFVLENEEAKWIFDDKGPILVDSENEKKILYKFYDHNVLMQNKILCFDGILVAGSPDGYSYRGKAIFPPSTSSCIMNIKNSLKTQLTPRRFIDENAIISKNPRLQYIIECHNIAEGLIWEKIIRNATSRPKMLWKLVFIYGFDLKNIRKEILWEYLYIPALDDKNKLNWIKLKEIIIEGIENVSVSKGNHYVRFYSSKYKYDFPHKKEYYSVISNDPNNTLLWLIMGFMKLSYDVSGFIYRMTDDFDKKNIISISDSCYRSKTKLQMFFPRSIILFCSEWPIETDFRSSLANVSHQLIKKIQEIRYKENLTIGEKIVVSLVEFLTRTQVIKILKLNHPKLTVEFKEIGIQFKIFEESLSPEFKPPYKILTRECTVLEITQEHFYSWAELKNEEMV